MHEVKYEPPVPDNWTPTHEALQAANDRMWSMIYRYVMAKVAEIALAFHSCHDDPHALVSPIPDHNESSRFMG